MDLKTIKLELIKKVIATDNEDLIRSMQQLIRDYAPQKENYENRLQFMTMKKLDKQEAVAEEAVKYCSRSSHENKKESFTSENKNAKDHFQPMSVKEFNNRINKSLLDYENNRVISQDELEKEILTWKLK